MKHPIHPEERNGYRNPLEKGYSVGKYLWRSFWIFAFGLIVLWWPHILRMLNAIVQ